MRLWGIIRTRQKMKRQEIVPLASGELSDIVSAMDDILKKMDLPRPILLPKHEQELTAYGRTYFLPRDFMESVSFDRFEIEILRDDGKIRRSNDPRNDFSYGF